MRFLSNSSFLVDTEVEADPKKDVTRTKNRKAMKSPRRIDVDRRIVNVTNAKRKDRAHATAKRRKWRRNDRKRHEKIAAGLVTRSESETRDLAMSKSGEISTTGGATGTEETKIETESEPGRQINGKTR